MIEGVFNKDGKYYIRYNKNGVSHFKQVKTIYTLFVEDENGEYFDIIKKKKMKRYDYNKKILFNESKNYYELMKKYVVELKPYFNFIFEDWKENNNQLVNSKIWYLDIEAIDLNDRKFPEPKDANAPVTHIQILDSQTKKVIIFMIKDSPKMREKYPDVDFKVFDDEYEMFLEFLSMLKKENPTIITAWNGMQFDFPYIYNRLKKLGINPNHLSPLHKTSYSEMKEGNRIIYDVTAEGVYLLDSLDIYKKFTYTDQKSYSLEYTAKLILKEGEGKISYKQYKSIFDFFEKDYDGFTEYAIKDPIVLRDIMEKVGLMNLVIMLSKTMGVNYDKIFGTVYPWTNYLTLISLKDNNILSSTDDEDDRPIVGGYVKNPQIGKHNWVASEDANSMYPSIMLSFNISPETYISYNELPDELKYIYNLFRDEDETKLLEKWDEISKILEKYPNYIFAGLGFFRNDKKGLIPTIIEKTYYGRKDKKNKMLKYEALLGKVS